MTLPIAAERARSIGRKLPSALAAATIPVAAVGSVFYYAGRSVSFDDGDSVSFALALRDFDLDKQQPQPPGFPLYVALGRLLLTLRQDDLWVLTTVSSVSAGLAVAAIFWLAYRFAGNRLKPGLVAALLMAFTPAFWLTGEKALSDVPAVAAVLWSIAALVASRQGPSFALGLAGMAAGLSLGFRPQNAVAVIPFAVYALWSVLCQKKVRDTLFLVCGAIAGVLLWLVPVSISAGGLGRYAYLAQGQSQHVLAADSIFAIGPLTAASIRFRATQFFDTLSSELAGISLPQPLDVGALIALSLSFIALVFALSALNWRHKATRLLVVWLCLALAQSFLLESLDRPRLMLLFIPAMVLLAAIALDRLPSVVAYTVALAASALLFAHSQPLANALVSESAPAVQGTAFVREHFAPADTLLAAAGSFRYLQYNLSDYKTYYLYSFNRESMQADVDSGRYARMVVFDRDEFQSVQDVLSEGKKYLPSNDITFERDPLLHRENSRVRVVVLTRADLVGADDLRLPASGTIKVGVDDERFLGSGWFRREEIGGVAGRWVGGSDTGELRVALAPAEYRLHFFATAFPPGQFVTPIVNGSPLSPIALKQDWAEYEIALPSRLLTNPVTVITFKHGTLRSAFEATGGASSDRRPLAAAYSWFSFAMQR